MDRRRPLALAALLAAETAVLACAVAVGRTGPLALPRSDLGGWMATAPPADALMAVVRVVAIGCAGWLLASTVAYTVSIVRRRPAGLAALVTLPVVRSIADRAVAAALVTSGLGGGTALATPEAEVLVPPGAHSVAAEPVAGSGAPAAPRATTTPTPAAGHPRRDAWVIAEGQHLWGIARALLERELPSDAPPPTDREIHARWLALLEANADGLASGNPDLVHPGEVLVVPDPGRP